MISSNQAAANINLDNAISFTGAFSGR